MSHLFTTEHDMRSGIQRFVRQSSRDRSLGSARPSALPALFRRAGQLGLLGINKPSGLAGWDWIFPT